MSFKNTKELLQALIDGKKIIHSYYEKDAFIYLHEGKIWSNSTDKEFGTVFNEYEKFEIVKEKKKITLYNYIYKIISANPKIFESGFTSHDWSFFHIEGRKLLKTETKEIEVDNE